MTDKQKAIEYYKQFLIILYPRTWDWKPIHLKKAKSAALISIGLQIEAVKEILHETSDSETADYLITQSDYCKSLLRLEEQIKEL